MQLQIDSYVIDTEARQVLRLGHEVPLSHKAFQLLAILAEARPKALSKNELHQALWPKTFVVDANLSNLVGEIRAALGDSARDPRFIRTVYGYGYAFCGETAPDVRDRRMRPTTFWLVFGEEQFPLRSGENIVGRSPDANIRLAVAGVSRRHARIVIADDEAFVEDAGSKNGTFVQGERIASRRRLGPDEEIAFGSARVRLQVIRPTDVTETM
jgi:DNA-binding winged helix-turn-helix (wHTH) protein